ncbi:hypothetical protein DSUL_80082 [Desulfovibrionales bacterium]
MLIFFNRFLSCAIKDLDILSILANACLDLSLLLLVKLITTPPQAIRKWRKLFLKRY